MNPRLKYGLLLMLTLSLLSFDSFGQYKGERKILYKEIIFGVGASNFLGDLGGFDTQGTHYFPIDINWNTTRPSGHVGYRLGLKPWLSTKTFFQYAVLKGDDAWTSEPSRRNRNLSFRTHLFELSQHIEYIFFKNDDPGARHKIYGLKGMRFKNSAAYLFSGIAVFGFIPQGPGDGGWTNLRPLKTEGQGLPGGGKPYGIISLGIPMGIGFKVSIDPVWRFSMELSYTQTFTDYLDDVSGVYYDNAAIQSAYGSQSAYFADPSSGAFPTWTHAGELRGDAKHKDGYFFANVSFARDLGGVRTRRIKWKYKRRYRL